MDPIDPELDLVLERGHEEMGFHAGWGYGFGQLVALVKSL